MGNLKDSRVWSRGPLESTLVIYKRTRSFPNRDRRAAEQGDRCENTLRSMGILLALALFTIVAGAAYYRFRENFSDLAAATDSKRSDSFWVIVTLIWTIVMLVLYFAFYRHGYTLWKSY